MASITIAKEYDVPEGDFCGGCRHFMPIACTRPTNDYEACGLFTFTDAAGREMHEQLGKKLCDMPNGERIYKTAKCISCLMAGVSAPKLRISKSEFFVRLIDFLRARGLYLDPESERDLDDCSVIYFHENGREKIVFGVDNKAYQVIEAENRPWIGEYRLSTRHAR
jgi:hypothetical protein